MTTVASLKVMFTLQRYIAFIYLFIYSFIYYLLLLFIYLFFIYLFIYIAAPVESAGEWK